MLIVLCYKQHKNLEKNVTLLNDSELLSFRNDYCRIVALISGIILVCSSTNQSWASAVNRAYRNGSDLVFKYQQHIHKTVLCGRFAIEFV